MLLLFSHTIVNTFLKIHILKSSFGPTFIASYSSNSLFPLALKLPEKKSLFVTEFHPSHSLKHTPTRLYPSPLHQNCLLKLQ